MNNPTVATLLSINPGSSNRCSKQQNNKQLSDSGSNSDSLKDKGYSFLSPFNIADFDDGIKPVTTLELAILQVLEEIKNIKNWNAKIKIKNITEGWISDLSARFDSKVINYAIDELLLYSDRFTGKVAPGPVDKTYVADDYIEHKTFEIFSAAVAKLEQSYDVNRIWSIDSRKDVLNLIDPSLYPLIFGVSRSVSVNLNPAEAPSWKKTMGTGDILRPSPPKQSNTGEEYSASMSDDHVLLSTRYKSRKFQWLPSEFQVTGGKVKILSYINNLHPEHHSGMYTAIESIFEQFIPLFSSCLTESCRENTKPLRVDPSLYQSESYNEYKARVRKYDRGSSSGSLPDGATSSANSDDDNSTNSNSGLINSDEEDMFYSFLDEKVVQEPKKIPFFPRKIPTETVRVDLKNKRLQVIVKLVNIMLSPENPKYEGDFWHVEGIQNENIVVIGVYCYDQANVSSFSIELKAQICEPDHGLGEAKWVSEIYRLQDGFDLSQYLGKVSTLKGRCLVFPNFYQHRIEPFELEDKTSTGFKKLLYFFLVDPTDRIYSTANIPPQQKEWFEDDITKTENQLTQIPELVSEKIFESLDWPIDIREAIKFKEELTKERKAFSNQLNRVVFGRPFYLWLL